MTLIASCIVLGSIAVLVAFEAIDRGFGISSKTLSGTSTPALFQA